MPGKVERFANHALGRPFHAALVELRTRSLQHGHRDYYEVMAVADGAGEHHVVTADGRPRQLPLRAGDVVLVRPQDRHAIAGGLRFYNVAFPATGWRAFVSLAKLDGGWERSVLPPHATLPDDRAVRACAIAVEQFNDKPTTLNLVRFWADIAALLPTGSAAGAASAVPDWLTAATAAMANEDNLRNGVHRLQALAHVSAAHLSRSMRRHYGMTPGEFVADLRLRHAATLLATTGEPVGAIAYASGFGSPSYFIRRFHAAHGLTPRQFRNTARRAFVPR